MLTIQKSDPKHETPRVDLLKSLLEIFTEEQLEQFLRKCTMARACSNQTNQAGASEMADVIVRFKAASPRWMGVELWEEAKK